MRREDRHRFGPKSSDLALDSEGEPPIGAHMVTRRRGYMHHGIYVGRGQVVQYGGLSRGLRRGPVEEVSLAQFADGWAIWVRRERSKGLDGYEVAGRARLRLGEDRYHLLTNNCEHFCEWCLRGEHRSYQVEELMARYRRVRQSLIEPFTFALFRLRRMSEVRHAADNRPHHLGGVESAPRPLSMDITDRNCSTDGPRLV